jgi:hypothetical protein
MPDLTAAGMLSAIEDYANARVAEALGDREPAVEPCRSDAALHCREVVNDRVRLMAHRLNGGV